MIQTGPCRPSPLLCNGLSLRVKVGNTGKAGVEVELSIQADQRALFILDKGKCI